MGHPNKVVKYMWGNMTVLIAALLVDFGISLSEASDFKLSTQIDCGKY